MGENIPDNPSRRTFLGGVAGAAGVSILARLAVPTIAPENGTIPPSAETLEDEEKIAYSKDYINSANQALSAGMEIMPILEDGEQVDWLATYYSIRLWGLVRSPEKADLPVPDVFTMFWDCAYVSAPTNSESEVPPGPLSIVNNKGETVSWTPLIGRKNSTVYYIKTINGVKEANVRSWLLFKNDTEVSASSVGESRLRNYPGLENANAGTNRELYEKLIKLDGPKSTARIVTTDGFLDPSIHFGGGSS